MKSIITGFISALALAGCAINSPMSPEGTGTTKHEKEASKAPDFLTRPLGFTSTVVEKNKYEVTYAGPWRYSRDALEGGLLYRAALLAKSNGSATFRFMPMLGETGPLSHPSGVSPSFGAAYGHWQPHWSYRTEAGWQPWHPEWGDRFWADRLAKGEVEWVEVHAMVELRGGAFTAGERTDFEVAAILRDLKPFAN